jgi:PAS domain S-box-containing protein
MLLQYEDITERKRAEAALRDNEARLDGILRSAHDAIITVDAEQRIVRFNRAAERMFGCVEAQVLGQPLDHFIPEQLRAAHRDHLPTFGPSDTTNRSMRSRGVLTARRADGTEFPIEASISQSPVSGQILYTAIVRDITERIRADEDRLALERKLMHTQKLESLGVLAGGIAHDFNNLLQAIMGHTELALLDVEPGSNAGESLAQVALAARRAADLTGQMLAYSGKGHFVVAPLDLTTLVIEMASLLRASIPRQVVVRYQVATRLPPVIGDEAQLRQVALNLIVNAAEAIGSSVGEIVVTTGARAVNQAFLATTYLAGDLPEGEYTYLAVSDTGCGIDEEMAALIFEPFFTTKFTGRGLGLAAVLGIVRGHHGAIHVQSAPELGSTFTVLLPRASAPDDA